MPTMSIIVPIYNVEKYLPECIKSILVQTFTDFELILVDDGSTDNSGKVCEDFARNDSRIRVIHKKNEGVSKARNIGIKDSIGEYLMFVDADDTIENTCISVIYQSLDEYDCDAILFGLAYNVFENDLLIKSSVNTFNKKILLSKNEFSDLFRVFFNSTDLFSSCNKCYRAKLVKENNIQFNEESVIYEDFEFNLNVFRLCNTILNLPDILYYYRCIKGTNPLSKRHKYNLVKNISNIIECLSSFISNTKKHMYFPEINMFVLQVFDTCIKRYIMHSSQLSFGLNKKFIKEIKASKWYPIFVLESSRVSIIYSIFNKLIYLKMYGLAYVFIKFIKRK